MSARSTNEGANDEILVLLVDDNVQHLNLLATTLTSPRYRILTATSGKKALDLAANKSFAAAILDVRMPIMDGFETARQMPIMETSRSTPIQFLTGQVSDRTQEFEGYEVVCDDGLEHAWSEGDRRRTSTARRLSGRPAHDHDRLPRVRDPAATRSRWRLESSDQPLHGPGPSSGSSIRGTHSGSRRVGGTNPVSRKARKTERAGGARQPG